MRVVRIIVPTSGTVGSATGSASVGVPFGVLRGIAVYYGPVPGTTTVTVSTELNGVAKTLLNVTGNSDIPLSPLVIAALNSTGGSSTTEVKPAVGGNLKVDVASSDPDAQAVVVVAVIDEN